MNLPNNLREAVETAGDGLAIIAAAGTTSSPISALTNQALGTALPETRGDPTRKSTAPTLTASASSDAATLVLSAENVDLSTTMAEDDERDDVLSICVSMAGIVLFSVHMHDVGRSGSVEIPRVMTAIERSLALRVNGTAPVLPRRRMLLVAVTDFDDVESTHEEVSAYVERTLTQAYERIELPEDFVATTLSDVFDVRIAVVRSRIHSPTQFNADVDNLGTILHDAARTYADAGLAADSVPGMVEKVKTAIQSGLIGSGNGTLAGSSQARGGSSRSAPARSLPSEREMKATFTCGTAMQSALDKFRSRTKLWRASVDAGRVIANFAVENDKLILRTLEAYDKDAAPFKSTSTFLRKREELNQALLSDSYILFSKQALKVRESAYQIFRSKLARIRINDQVEKNVRVAVREAEMHFVRNSEALRSKLGNWRCDYDRYELVNHMRDDATERLQLARLQGSYVPNVRAPIMFAFHTLLLAPFGRDSRMAQTPVEEMKAPYDPDKAKQPAMMRSRPFQRGHGLKFNEARDGFKQESLDFIAPLYEGMGDKKSE